MISDCGNDLESLWRHLPQDKLVQAVAEMGIQILKALNILHEIGYCHQDLKLENICYKNGAYYLIDFGCAIKIKKGCETVSVPRGNSFFASVK
jgi:serine/threonine protein kinase